MRILIVGEEVSDKRIDKYLIEELGLTRSKIQKLIAGNKILVNDKEVKNSYTVKTDDEITIDDDIEEVIDIAAEDIPLEIYYEDDDVIVVNKVSGMVVHPSIGHYSGTLVNALLFHCNKLSDVNGMMRPGIVHRIDKDTSGLLLVAKNDKAHLNLSNQLKDKTVTRKYIALVNGLINHETGTIDAPIGRDLLDRKKMAVTDVNAKEAITHFKVIERYKTVTLVECQLETGRTHQIRVHFQYIGHPIVNDPIYGQRRIINDFGQMLHAAVIGFRHPKTNDYMEFEAPLPEMFIEILDKYKDK
ncbi:MAG: RluA family pseudouridine synthase [Bacilli bacterium]|nr:RluA family pseudouridine synthase [Bacilli bacterium]